MIIENNKKRSYKHIYYTYINFETFSEYIDLLTPPLQFYYLTNQLQDIKRPLSGLQILKTLFCYNANCLQCIL